MTTKISGDNISAIANTGVNWNAVTVADGSTQLNASAGNGYFLDTNAGVIEVFLPSSPTRGDTVVLADYSGTFATNKVLVNTGGALIDSTAGGPGSSNDFEIITNNAVVELVYVDAAKGWLVKTNSTSSGLTTIGGAGVYGSAYIVATGGTVTTSTDYKIHTFTGDGCFVVSSVGNPAGSTTVDYLVVAGGGGAGANHGAGGGAGGYRESYSAPVSGCYTASPLATPTGITLTVTTYPITVGAGGSGGPGLKGADGSNSVFSTITSAGGGGGGSNTPNGLSDQPGNNGGSGGGSKACGTAGTGNTPPVSPPQGNNGGSGAGAPDAGQGGGGGATAVGANGGGLNGGNGGAGAGTLINPATGQSGPGPSQYYAGGGAGNAQLPGGTQGSGGIGGGGPANETSGSAGTANTGGGGGASIGSGGKGIVIIRYKYQ